MAIKAFWNDQLIAESTDTVVVEHNHYFPKKDLKMNFFKESKLTSNCPWKGTANYYTLSVNGSENQDAAWYYAEPKEAAKEIKDRVAFWKGVKVVES